PLEVVLELGRLGFLSGQNFGGNDGILLIDLTQARPRILVVAHPLRNDVARAGERLVSCFHFLRRILAIVGRVSVSHVRLGGGDRIGGSLLGEQQVSERLQAFFAGDGGARTLLGAERRVD